MDVRGASAGMRARIAVAIGPKNNEMTHHKIPLRFFDCAMAELMKVSVNQPTA